MIDKPGIYRISADEYHADPCVKPSLSSSLAKVLLAQSPIHAWTESPRLNPDFEPKDSATFSIGRAAHRAILGAGGDYVEIPPDYLASNGAASTKAAKDFIQQAGEEGMTALKSDVIEQIEFMRRKAETRLKENGINIDCDRSELSAFAQINDCWVRAMFDNVPIDQSLPIYDLKTCENATPDACMRAIMNYGYDVQDAHYRSVWRAATGEDRGLVFIFQEKKAPAEICIIELSNEDREIADQKISRARDVWKMSVDTGRWAGYPAGVSTLRLPPFFHAKWMERYSVEQDFLATYGHDIYDTTGESK